MPLLLVTLWSPSALNHHINLEFVIPNISHILRTRTLAARGIHFCEYRNNKTTSESILAHCAKYYYEKCDFCWRHSGVPLHWIPISIWNLSFRISPIFEGQENWLPEAPIFAKKTPSCMNLDYHRRSVARLSFSSSLCSFVSFFSFVNLSAASLLC